MNWRLPGRRAVRLAPRRRSAFPSPARLKLLSTLLCCLAASVLAHAHGLTFTRTEAVFNRPGEVDITIDYNLALVLPNGTGYYALTKADPGTQKAAVERAIPEILATLKFYTG